MYTEVTDYCKNDTKPKNAIFVQTVLFNVKSVVYIVRINLKSCRKGFVTHIVFIYLSTQNV
jgi:hypothetical protein